MFVTSVAYACFIVNTETAVFVKIECLSFLMERRRLIFFSSRTHNQESEFGWHSPSMNHAYTLWYAGHGFIPIWPNNTYVHSEIYIFKPDVSVNLHCEYALQFIVHSTADTLRFYDNNSMLNAEQTLEHYGMCRKFNMTPAVLWSIFMSWRHNVFLCNLSYKTQPQ